MDAEFQGDRFIAAYTERLSVSEFIGPWITQKCFPMIMVEESSNEEGDGGDETGKFSITQSCVFMSEETRGILWPIHVKYRTSGGKTGEFVF